MQYLMGDFQLRDRMIRYSAFIPKFYNLCKSYGFEPGKMMPSRAFCSDENQGFPIILIAKHFGTFPFDHGVVGGIVATDRHGPHAHHGKDLVIIQASHVGYDPATGAFGIYRRMQVDGSPHATSCGKICGVLDWYLKKYHFARENISFSTLDGEKVVIIDNQILDGNRRSGLFLNTRRLIAMETENLPRPMRVFSTSKAFRLGPGFQAQLPDGVWKEKLPVPIGDALAAELFFFKREISDFIEGQDQLEQNLSHFMPLIVTSPYPTLSAAQYNTQIEFDRTYRSIVKESGYKDKNLAFIAGINIDISPRDGQLIPLTKFVPWAAYFQIRGKRAFILEQEALMEALLSQSTENPDRIEMSAAIHKMEKTPEVKISL
jgi:hypothetical protein